MSDYTNRKNSPESKLLEKIYISKCLEAGSKLLPYDVELKLPPLLSDCEKDGKIYKSGQKILSRQKPCDVCFCQGGDLLCSKIHCFTRNDCEGINVPGRCCPSYDHCDLPRKFKH